MRSEVSDVPEYPKGDLRRMLSVLAAIDTTVDATLVKLVARTGIDKKTITMLVQQAIEQAGVRIEKEGAVYRLQDWGPVINRAGALQVLTGALNAPSMGAIDTGEGVRTMEEKDIEILEEAPAMQRIAARKVQVGHVHVYRNPNGTWSLERVHEVSAVVGSPATVTFRAGPIGHATRIFFADDKVDITRASAKR